MQTVNVDDLMRRVSLFNGLTREEVLKIFSKGVTMRCSKGEKIFEKGTVGSQMYVVLGGTIGIFEGQRQLAQLKAGEMFGEMALVNHEPRSATAMAVEDSHVFVLSESIFDRLMTKRVAIRILLNIIRTLSMRLRAANTRG